MKSGYRPLCAGVFFAVVFCTAVCLLLSGCRERESASSAPSSSAASSQAPESAAAPSSAPAEPSEPPVSSDPTEHTEQVDVTGLSYWRGELELPVEGATGYAADAMALLREPSANAEQLGQISGGQGFAVLEEQGDWWRVRVPDLGEGWVCHDVCLINLPDVIPSIVYRNTNGSASLFRTSGEAIPGITGEQLYDSLCWNERLQREEYTVAVLYQMAKRICAAQQLALSEGYTLVLVEGFRPYDVQQQVVTSLAALIEEKPELRAGVENKPWSMDWFITEGVSNHQQGYAIDVSLAQIVSTQERAAGSYAYTAVTSYLECDMPTAMHELSLAAASMKSPVTAYDFVKWQEVPVAAGMTEGALALRRFCTSAGLTPLASEWWHFNDLDCLSVVQDSWEGKFRLTENVSFAPHLHLR